MLYRGLFSCKSKFLTMIMGTNDDGNAADDVFSKDLNYTKGTLVNVTTNAVRGDFPHLNRYQNPDDSCSIRFLSEHTHYSKTYVSACFFNGHCFAG